MSIMKSFIYCRIITTFLLFISLALWLSCEDGNEMNEESQSTYHFDLIYENTGITKDDNDNYHLTIIEIAGRPYIE